MDEKLKEAFHLTWDAFPGMARLIGRDHRVLAVNLYAREHGFEEGQICSAFGASLSHATCKAPRLLATGEAQLDRPTEKKVRGWAPVEGYPDLYIHFSLPIPEEICG